MLEHLVLLSAAIAGLSLFGALRGQTSNAVGRWHTLLLIAVTGVDLWALRPGEDQRLFWGILALGLTGVVVVLPAVLDRASRWAFARGHFTWAVRLAGARVTLMPGAGLEPSLDVVRALEIVERRGLDPALAYLTQLAREAEDRDGLEPSLVHEQVVTLLLHGQRWREGTEYYERYFHPGYAVFRPGLALSLLRAYGERGRLDAAAGLLRAFESSHVRGEARAVELVAQAWLTFAAYAGDSRVVDELDESGLLRRMGVSPATGAYLRGVAWTHAGDPRRARAALSRVEDLARPTDHGVVAESRAALVALDHGGTEDGQEQDDEPLSPELARYAKVVSARLRAAASIRGGALPRGRPWASVAAGLGLVGVYTVGVATSAVGADWLALGATSTTLWRSGAWWRVASAPWVHMDLLSLSVSLCALWLAGRGIELSRGTRRTALVMLVAPPVGLVIAHLLGRFPMHLGVGGSLVATAVVAGGLAPLVLDVHRDRRRRRNLIIAHLMLLLVTSVGSIPTPIGLDVSPIAWAVTAILAFALAAPAATPGSTARRIWWVRGEWALAGLAGGLVISAWTAVALGDEAAPTQTAEQRCEQGGLAFDLGPGWMPTPSQAEGIGVLFGVPVFEGGLVDGIALRSGVLWQVVVEPTSTAEPPRSILSRRDPALEDAVALRPAPWPEALEVAGASAWVIRKNGDIVARSYERRVDDRQVAVVLSPGAPPRARDLAMVGELLSGTDRAGTDQADGLASCAVRRQ